MPDRSTIAPPWSMYGAARANFPAWTLAIALLLLYRRKDRLSAAQVRSCYRAMVRGMFPPATRELLAVRQRLTFQPLIQAEDFCRFAVDSLKGCGIPALAKDDNPETLAGILAHELGVTPRCARSWYNGAQNRACDT